MSPDVETAYNFITELLKTRQVSDATFAAAKDRFGEKGVVDIIGLSGWYSARPSVAFECGPVSHG